MNYSRVFLCSILVFFVVQEVQSLHKRCIRCRSRGELGTCGDPFPINVTETVVEQGLHVVACPSGWCGKLIEGTVGTFRSDGTLLWDPREESHCPDIVDYDPPYLGSCGSIDEGLIDLFILKQYYGAATERMCLQRAPSDYEERCAYTMWNRKKVYMCFCNGDLCNSAVGISTYPLVLAALALIPIYNYYF